MAFGELRSLFAHIGRMFDTQSDFNKVTLERLAFLEKRVVELELKQSRKL